MNQTHPTDQERAREVADDYVLPCDVHLPPATIIRKGCTLKTLMTAFGVRERNPDMQMDIAARTSPSDEVRGLIEVAQMVCDDYYVASGKIEVDGRRGYGSIKALSDALARLTPPSRPVSGEGERGQQMVDWLTEEMKAHIADARKQLPDSIEQKAQFAIANRLRDAAEHCHLLFNEAAPSRPPEPAASGEGPEGNALHVSQPKPRFPQQEADEPAQRGEYSEPR